ncbi:conserved hypothetical protein [Methylocella silvestris BL2]|uniref:Cellobiose phosphorylase n=1 Tax=Methylocella silvestris (strain DSM 15510 / CIP 108128 / LMG 27833 / NCIMB 13906 / BL2) TaxID=395965 RepID=B8EKL5_METSB|nr:hypothetical protein [Methylocella silvestris]ACK51385.1 conserved hypothetical protein [Methylocella silvestris BL2]
MTGIEARRWTTPRDENLGLRRISNACGLSVAALPNGALFAIEHQGAGAPVLVNQTLGSPVAGAISRIYLRIEGEEPIEITGPGAAMFGQGADRFVWDSQSHGIFRRVTLLLQPSASAWIWRLDVENRGGEPRAMDAILIQDIGLGPRGFLMNNEAYVSQYVDHFISPHERFGPVVMSRQNLAQDGFCPFAMHGCFDGAAGFATDGKQLFGPAFRDSDLFRFPYGTDLPNQRLQHEMACVAIQSTPLRLGAGARESRTFFGLFAPDQPQASSDVDLARIDAIDWRAPDFSEAPLMARPARSIVEAAPVAIADALDDDEIARLYPDRFEEEWIDGRLMSFFTPDGPHNRHVVLRDKERIVTRRHGALMRSGAAMLPDDSTLCATAWMHGVFAAQLTIGNTSFHKLFSVSRDPYNVTRGSGLRMLAEIDGRWRLLATPSAFEIGLNDCRWIYRIGARTIIVSAIVSGADSAMAFALDFEGEPCRFLVFGHLALGEREYDHHSRVEIDPVSMRVTLRPDPDWLWGQRYPQAAYHIVSPEPADIAAIGGDELLYEDAHQSDGSCVALRTRPVTAFSFAVVGSMTSGAEAKILAEKYARRILREELLEAAQEFWKRITRGARVQGDRALDTLIPWLAHDAMIHLTVPHGLEQYTGAAWGVRDVCQGPVELLLALRHDEPVKEILRLVFAQQYAETGDWPQWFMLDPYAIIQDRVSHGDVIIWPLKAVNDYIEATGDFAFLDEHIVWRGREDLERTPRKDSVLRHIEKLIEAIRARFVPGTHLLSYGHGDWNDSLQPVDPTMRDIMASSWTVSLLYQQLGRYAAILEKTARAGEATSLTELADAMRADFNALLVGDGIVAGYGVFEPGASGPELLLHPRDARTGLHYSLLPMTRSIIGDLFTPDQAEHHVRIINDHLLFADGARLMDRPVPYHGGPQSIFRRAESASFFGREIGLMYVHSHLRFGEALAHRGDLDGLSDALGAVNPISIGDRLESALPRQRNAFFSSSDAAFADRASASADWDRLKRGEIGLEGGWRIYSSGPGIFMNLLIRHGFGRQRLWGRETPQQGWSHATLEWDLDTTA